MNKLKKLAIALTAAVVGFGHSAKAVSIDPVENGTYAKGITEMVTDFRVPMNEYKSSLEALDLTRVFAEGEVPHYGTEVIKGRLAAISGNISMDYNEHVMKRINDYTVNWRVTMEDMLGKKEIYFPLFERELAEAGLPEELKYLAVIESALDPNAKSWVGAVGLWQFMPPTGREYGLRVDGEVDERRDPVKATKAAVRYLGDLAKMYDGDWHLALAAYNCGPGNVNKAIRKAGGNKNYWAIWDYLPNETRGYVPGFIAAAYSMEYATSHNLFAKHNTLDFNAPTAEVDGGMSFEQIADQFGIDSEELAQLNPELVAKQTPAGGKWSIRIPQKG